MWAIAAMPVLSVGDSTGGPVHIQTRGAHESTLRKATQREGEDN